MTILYTLLWFLAGMATTIGFAMAASHTKESRQEKPSDWLTARIILCILITYVLALLIGSFFYAPTYA
jgi:hypothetical protein